MRTTRLSTGSTLAYLKLPGGGPDRTPVVFLHGGPGVPDMRSGAAYMRRLADAGYEVYLYDQLGAGRPERLSNPAGYTITRAVADLDAFGEASAPADVPARLLLLGRDARRGLSRWAFRPGGEGGVRVAVRDGRGYQRRHGQ